MVQLAIWIVSLIIVIWAIVAIGIPLLFLGTAIVISYRRVFSGILGILFILLGASAYDSSPQLGGFIGVLGFGLVLYAFGVDEFKQQPKVTATEKFEDKKNDIEMDIDDSEIDDLYDDALRIVTESQTASASLLQRKLGIGYARAVRLIEGMERRGVVGPAEGSKPREVLIAPQDKIS